ncbi:MAG TPA: apolipoprotein N-acyltransferase [Abditibacterium sp.]|jgi:apolipoprotein N-acyltransferase
MGRAPTFLASRRTLTLLTAVLWWLAGAFQLFPLGWIALAPFFLLLEGLPAKQRFRAGYLTGFVSFWLINWWLVPTITRGAAAIDASPVLGFVLSLVAVTFIAAVHALQPALVALLWRGHPIYRPLIVGAAWALGDFMRTVTPLAHEWGALAFSQTSDLPLLQIAAVFGQHGLTFVCAAFAACAALWFHSRNKIWVWAPVLSLVALHGWGFWRLQRPISGDKLRVLVVQTAVPSLRKTGRAAGEDPFSQAFRLTKAAEKSGGKFDLVVWPETTARFARFNTSYGSLDWEQLRLEGPSAPLLIGAETSDEQNRRWNEAVLIHSNFAPQTRAKTRLVPFGERAPLAEWLPFLARFAPPQMLERGDGPKTFRLDSGMTLDTQICFESCFPQRVGGRFVVFLTNDEWFSGTEAPRQHRAMAVMRAVENGVPVVQSANGGYSFVVDPQGRLVVSTVFGMPATLASTVLVPR